MLKTYFLTKTVFFHPNLRTLKMYALASSRFGFRRSNISKSDKNILCIRQNHVLVEFLQTNTSFSYTSRHLILTKLGHSDRYLNHYSRINNGGVRGHDGVTGVKRVIFTKKASSPTEYIELMRDSCICISLTPSTKVITLKIVRGHMHMHYICKIVRGPMHMY